MTMEHLPQSQGAENLPAGCSQADIDDAAPSNSPQDVLDAALDHGGEIEEASSRRAIVRFDSREDAEDFKTSVRDLSASTVRAPGLPSRVIVYYE